MKKINIKIPKWYEIDTEKSNLQRGEIVFKEVKKELLKSFDDVDYMASFVQCFYTTSSDYRVKLDAFNKLLILRDIYNGDWKLDWTSIEKKYVIYQTNNGLTGSARCRTMCVLYFQTEKLRDEFFTNFKDLLETAKELL